MPKILTNAQLQTLFAGTYAATTVITAATAANPCAITSTAHGLLTDDYALIANITGNMNATAVGVFKVTKTGANTFTIPVDTTGLTYTSGGVVAKCTAGLVGLLKPFDVGSIRATMRHMPSVSTYEGDAGANEKTLQAIFPSGGPNV